jgi:hypothetical protein
VNPGRRFGSNRLKLLSFYRVCKLFAEPDHHALRRFL